jgi:lipoprotein-releasing system ATP-binding protein
LPTSGTIEYDGEDVTRYSSARLAAFRNERLGFVFQFHHLLPEFTALENVMMPGLIRGVGRAAIEQTARSLLSDVGLTARLTHRPGELSGGEQQRVALARALVMNPKLVLADEPTGNLDPQLALDILTLFEEINASGITVVFATHDHSLLEARPHRLVVIDEGRVFEARSGGEVWAGSHAAARSSAGAEARAESAHGLAARDVLDAPELVSLHHVPG